jgi:hypothetical protein
MLKKHGFHMIEVADDKEGSILYKTESYADPCTELRVIVIKPAVVGAAAKCIDTAITLD